MLKYLMAGFVIVALVVAAAWWGHKLCTMEWHYPEGGNNE